MKIRSVSNLFSLRRETIGPAVSVLMAAAIAISSSQADAPRELTYKTVDGKPLNIHLFTPESDGTNQPSRAAILMIHGGGWTSPGKWYMEPYCHHFAERGMTAVNVEFRLVSDDPPVRLPDCIADIRDALAFVRREAASLGIDPSRIALAGESAGGHLAAAAALLPLETGEFAGNTARPDALLLLNPALDLAAIPWMKGHKSLQPPQPGSEPEHADWKESARRLSPMAHVRAGLPPTLLIHGELDDVVPPDQSTRFAKALEQHGNKVTLRLMPGWKHAFALEGCGTKDQIAETMRIMDSFLAELGYIGKGVNLAALDGWMIVVDDAAIPSERYAAEELQRFLAQATGTNLSITNAPSKGAGSIFIGPGAVQQAGEAGFATDDLGPEDLRIKVQDGAIVIAGGRPRGTLYGVYTFLEDYARVRFLTADCTHAPRLKNPAIIGPVERTYRPPLKQRWSYYGEMENAEFAARLRCNMITDEERLGGRSHLRLINHTFARYVPWSKYGKEHPEYFNSGGKAGEQLCLTNPDVLRIVTEAALKELDSNPELKTVSISQNDNTDHCRCDKCLAIDEQEGSPMGSLLAFVNAVAAEVAKHHPDATVGTLAYKYSRKPPRNIKPLPNVRIQLCTIECCMNHPMDDADCPLNESFRSDMAGWGEICDDIYIWHYVVNFADYHIPCPNLQTIGPSIRWFIGHGAKGIMLQGAWNTRGGEFSELRNYIGSRLLWDPSLDDSVLIDEFLDLYYREAAPPIREFIEFARNKALASGRHQRCSRPASHYGLDGEVGTKGMELFAEAHRLARSDEIRHRVEKASICAHAMTAEAIVDPVDRYQMTFELARPGALPWFISVKKITQAMPHLERVLELCEKHGIRMASEKTSVERAKEFLRNFDDQGKVNSSDGSR